jgi:hypothetical protein
MSLSGDGPPELIVTSLVSADFFTVLGLKPEAGRFFRRGEDQKGQERVAVLGYGLWRDRFGSDPAAHIQHRHVSAAIAAINAAICEHGNGPAGAAEYLRSWNVRWGEDPIAEGQLPGLPCLP